jgi:hypothetical protein
MMSVGFEQTQASRRRTKMRFEMTKGYIDIEHNGKTARFWGDMRFYGFSAIANTMEWLPPHDGETVTDDERVALIREVKKHFRWRKYRVTFVNDKGKRYDGA